MSERRVVVTGIGVVSPLGNTLEIFWENLKAGRSGISRYAAFDSTNYACKIAGEVRNFDPSIYFKNAKQARRVDRFTQFAVAASKMAIEDSSLALDKIDPDRFGVIIGSGVGGLQSLEFEAQKLFEKGPDRVSPFVIALMITNMASGIVSMEHGFGGPNMSIVTACASSNNSIGEAWRTIKFGDADGFLAGGSEAAVCRVAMAGFSSMRALSTRNDEPERASRPWDIGRDGFVMGEGSGVVMLEELEHARARGARIYCELVGYGATGDAYHMTQPHPEGAGAARSMRIAMNHARVNPEDIDYINAHATSTPLGDIGETKAIKIALGEASKKVLVNATKSMTGHLLGAAGGIELAATIMSLRDGIVHPTINLDNPDPECDLDYVPHTAREARVKIAMSNSFGFGGHNSTLVVKTLE